MRPHHYLVLCHTMGVRLLCVSACSPYFSKVISLFLLSYTDKSGVLCLVLTIALILISICTSCPLIFLHFLCAMVSDLLMSLESKLICYGQI